MSMEDILKLLVDSRQPTQTQRPAQQSDPMTDLIGQRFELDDRILVPLPHPSGASQWFNVPENKARLARALEILSELREQFGRRE